MADYEVQFTLATTSGLLADYSTNIWSIFASTESDLPVAIAQLKDFYDAVRGVYSDNVTQGGHVIKAYNRDDTPPRAPVIEDTFTFVTAPTGAPAPHEVAITMSFQGLVQSGSPQSRRRGRIYLGPVTTDAIDSDGRIASAYVTTVVDAGDGLLTASKAAGAWNWNVWSTVNGAGTTVDNGWCDNAFDTQRRRGRDATSRTTFS